MAKEKLFRDEFVKSVTEPFGTISIPPQKAVRIAAISFFIGFGVLIAILRGLEYTRVEPARAIVVPDAQRIAISSVFANSVRIESLLAQEGEQAVPGKAIVLVSGADLTAHPALAGPANSLASGQSAGAGSGQRTASLLSTQAGHIERVLVRAGQEVGPGQPVAILNNNPFRLKFAVLVPSRWVGLVKRSEVVQIKVDSFPYQRFGTLAGRVNQVSQGSVPPGEIAAMFGIQPPGESMFIVDVNAVDPARGRIANELRPGMGATVDFPVEKKSMLDWIFVVVRKKTGSS